jgi:DNA adenine methylase
MISPLKRLGGKAKLVKWLLRHFPPHESYIEAFAAAAPTLLAKPRSGGQEVYNDLDGMFVNTFRVIRERGAELAEAIALTPYSRTAFEEARRIVAARRDGSAAVQELELARCHLVVIRQSFSASGRSWSTSGFGQDNRPRAWDKLPGVIVRSMNRLRGVFIEQRDYRYVLERYDHERALFYLDPPYFGVERAYYDVNRSAGFDHVAMRNALENVSGSVAVSYYANPENPAIERLYAGWAVHRKLVTVQAGDVKRKEEELLFVRASTYGRRRRWRVREIVTD